MNIAEKIREKQKPMTDEEILDFVTCGEHYNKCDGCTSCDERLKDEEEIIKAISLARQSERQKAFADVRKEIEGIDVEEFAKLFHENYEIASERYGWKTQTNCKVNFWDLPEANRKAMIATTIQMKLWLLAKLAEVKNEQS